MQAPLAASLLYAAGCHFDDARPPGRKWRYMTSGAGMFLVLRYFVQAKADFRFVGRVLLSGISDGAVMRPLAGQP